MARHGRRGAFTLVEVLVSVAILAILMTIAVIAYKHLAAAPQAQSADVVMKNLKGMVTEFDPTNVGKIRTIENKIYASGNPRTEAAPVGAFSDEPKAMAGVPAVYRTRQILYQLTRIPTNDKLVADLPPEMRLALAPGDDPNSGLTLPLLDGWKHPIIYVPAGGLTGVTWKQGAGASTPSTITNPNGQGFWASGGPDGDLSTADDNVYSWQK